MLYRALLGRNPDSGGLAGYTAAFRQERVDLARAFLASSEFRALLPDRQDPVAVTAVITLLYSEMLRRLPDDPELAGWVRYVIATGDIEGAVTDFIRSSEFEARPLTFADYVRILYLSLLARAPDADGAKRWEATLRTHIVNVVTESVTPSAEFQTRRRNICGT
jgi:hypothetical protein